jgi:2-polyprenyl-3-methyl-5-hydroxy-6-metoxy-1,4-benzoquinol methylase
MRTESDMPDNVVKEYGWKSASGPESCGYIAPAILARIESLKCQRVLDLGAGNGALCGAIHKLGVNVVGMDYDQQGVELARKGFPELSFYRMGVQDDPAELLQAHGRFDLVVSTEVVEHLFSPHLLPQFAAQVLKPGGRLLLTTPYHGYLKNLALSLVDGWDKHHTPLWHGGHIKFWSHKTIEQLLNQNGFVLEHFSGVGRLPYLWKSMVVLARLR